MMEEKNIFLVIALIVAVLFLFSGSFTSYYRTSHFYGMHYGFSPICGMMGGISCYWPAYTFASTISVLVIVILILLIILLIKKINSPETRK